MFIIARDDDAAQGKHEQHELIASLKSALMVPAHLEHGFSSERNESHSKLPLFATARRARAEVWGACRLYPSSATEVVLGNSSIRD